MELNEDDIIGIFDEESLEDEVEESSSPQVKRVTKGLDSLMNVVMGTPSEVALDLSHIQEKNNVENVDEIIIPKKKTITRRIRDQSYTQVRLKYRLLRRGLKIRYWLAHPYYHWWYLCALINIPLIILFFVYQWVPRVATFMILLNVFVAGIVRNGYFKRIVYEFHTLCMKFLVNLPGQKVMSLVVFQINHALHNISGIHTGCAMFTVTWATISVIILPIRYSNGDLDLSFGRFLAIEILSVIFLFCVSMMSIIAIPPIRLEYHNLFEITHRFFGWAAAILTLIIVCIALGPSFPCDFAFACVIFVLTFYPWFLIRRQQVNIMKIGKRAIALSFRNQLIQSKPGCVVKFSFSPLLEWHTFAVSGPIPKDIRRDIDEGYLTTIIARAGDWTGRLIDDALLEEDIEGNMIEKKVEAGTPYPKKMWVRFHTPPGFSFSARAYKEVLFIATGAGIAPIMYFLQPENIFNQRRHVLWIGNRPHETFGIFAETVFNIPDLIIHDTNEKGRPVVDKLALDTFKSIPNCQAVFIVANQPVTRAVQQTMFFAKVPCYGAEWDQ